MIWFAPNLIVAFYGQIDQDLYLIWSMAFSGQIGQDLNPIWLSFLCPDWSRFEPYPTELSLPRLVKIGTLSDLLHAKFINIYSLSDHALSLTRLINICARSNFGLFLVKSVSFWVIRCLYKSHEKLLYSYFTLSVKHGRDYF